MDVLVLDSQDDRAEWRTCMGLLPEVYQDVYSTPEWVSLHSFGAGAKGKLFVFRMEEDVWVHPVILRSISSIGKVHVDPGLRDIESPYGYGGPLSSSSDAGFLTKAWQAYRNWLTQCGVVAEFVRLHPLLENDRYLDSEMECTVDRETVSMELSRFLEDPMPYSSGTRYMLRRAQREDLQVLTLDPVQHIEEFRQLYYATMNMKGASRYYYFDEAYFRELAEIEHSTSLLLTAVIKDRWVASALFIGGRRFMHYHLSASDPAARIPGVTNCLIHAAAQHGAKRGYRTLHLGGGTSGSPTDPLLAFKRSMSSHSHTYRIGRAVRDRNACAILKQTWENEYPSLVEKYGNQVLCYRNTE